MKKYLLTSEKNFYKANLHCHSTCSDGNFTPEHLKKIYTENGYNIIAFTDHEHLIDHSDLNDENFLAITSCEVAIKEFENLSTLKALDMKVAHLNFYAKDAKNVDTPCYSSVYDHYINDEIKDLIVHSCGEYQRSYTKEGINDMISKANSAGFLVTYNHPRWSLENACDYLKYENLWAVEIYNNSTAISGLYEYNINAYDDFLRNGQKMACTACDDNHNGKDDSFGGFVMINSSELAYHSIIDAMEKHNLYACSGKNAPQITELYIEGNKAHIKCKNASYATISTKGRRSECVNIKGDDEAIFDVFENDGYIRFDVVATDGSRSNTCAYFINDIF